MTKTIKKRDVAMSLQDLEMLRQNVYYNQSNGVFYRKSSARPVTLCWSNTQATIPVQNGVRKKYFTAWRVAVFLSKGYYPTFEDAVVFDDGNNKNFRINNISVCHPDDDEQTILDFSLQHDLSPQTVNNRMKNSPRVKRIVRNWSIYFYKKSDFIKKCNDLMGRGAKKPNEEFEDDFIRRVKPVKVSEEKRGNKLGREFLRMWTGDMPTKWDMTLC